MFLMKLLLPWKDKDKRRTFDSITSEFHLNLDHYMIIVDSKYLVTWFETVYK